jgi:hypothetical protein
MPACVPASLSFLCLVCRSHTHLYYAMPHAVFQWCRHARGLHVPASQSSVLRNAVSLWHDGPRPLPTDARTSPSPFTPRSLWHHFVHSTADGCCLLGAVSFARLVSLLWRVFCVGVMVGAHARMLCSWNGEMDSVADAVRDLVLCFVRLGLDAVCLLSGLLFGCCSASGAHLESAAAYAFCAREHESPACSTPLVSCFSCRD